MLQKGGNAHGPRPRVGGMQVALKSAQQPPQVLLQSSPRAGIEATAHTEEVLMLQGKRKRKKERGAKLPRRPRLLHPSIATNQRGGFVVNGVHNDGCDAHFWRARGRLKAMQ